MDVIRMAIVAAAIVALSGVAQAQTYRQFRDELYCHDDGNFTAQALQDYRNGIPLATALARADGYLCTAEAKQICAIRRHTLKSGIAQIYSQLGPQAHVRAMTPSQFLNFVDMARTGDVRVCMDVVRSHH